MVKPVKIFGHRGCRFRPGIPENSHVSYGLAMSKGAQGIELDVYSVTRSDGRELAISHGELKDLTNLQEYIGSPGFEEKTVDTPITSFSWDQLKHLNLRDSDGHVTPLPLPRLDNALELVQRFRDTARGADKERAEDFIVNIEIKYPEPPDTTYIRHVTEDVAQAIERCLKEGWKYKNFQVSSFSVEILDAMKKRLPDVPIGALLCGDREPWDISEAELKPALAGIRHLKPQTVNLTLPSLTPKAIDMIHETGAKAVAWTSGEKIPDQLPAEEREALHEQLTSKTHPIDRIITDFPGQMHQFLNGPDRAVSHG